jgi:FkbM family methyltransferase
MKLTKWLPKALEKFVRERMTIYVYNYGFRPSAVVREQIFKFKIASGEMTVKADYRTALYDMIAEVIDYDAYQLQQLQFDSNSEHHILDIGANVGVSAIVFSQIPRATITCYEPDPGNCAFLRQNLKLNGITNVKVFQAAVATVNGTTEFQIDEESTGGHVVRGSVKGKSQKIKVSVTTLERAIDDCGSDVIDLLKCDCEGGEYDIVEQITPKLAKRIRNITVEVHDLDQSHNLQSISSHLSRLGYQLSHKPDMWERSALHLLLATRA